MAKDAKNRVQQSQEGYTVGRLWPGRGPGSLQSLHKTHDLCVLFSGHQVCRPNQKVGGVRSHFSIHYVLDGAGVFKVNQRVYPIEKGTAFVFFPGHPISYHATREDPWTYAWVGFVGTRAGELLAQANITPDNPLLRADYSAELAIAFRSLLDCLLAKRPGVHAVANGYLHQILGRLIEASQANRPNPKMRGSNAAEQARQFIETNFQRQISVTQICRLMGYSRTYLTTFFKNRFNESMQAYLIRYRMDRAKEILGQTELNVGQVADSVGYRNYPVFEKRFKVHTGYTPTRYRALER